jgi:hypothetical protein
MKLKKKLVEALEIICFLGAVGLLFYVGYFLTSG